MLAASMFASLKLSLNQKINREFIGYFLISLLALAVDLGSFSFSLRILDFPWFISAVIGFCAGVFVTYSLSIFFVFSDRKIKNNKIAEFSIFISIGIGGLLVTQFILWLGIELLNLHPELTKMAAAGFTFLYNFLLRKYFLFTTS